MSRTVSERETRKQLLRLRDTWSDLRETKGPDEKVQRARMEAKKGLPKMTSASATLHIHTVYNCVVNRMLIALARSAFKGLCMQDNYSPFRGHCRTIFMVRLNLLYALWQIV